MRPRQRLLVAVVVLGALVVALVAWFAVGAGPDGASALAVASASKSVAEAPPRDLETPDELQPAPEAERHEAPSISKPSGAPPPVPVEAPKIFLVGEIHSNGGAVAGGTLRVARRNSVRTSAHPRELAAQIEARQLPERNVLQAQVLNADYRAAVAGVVDESSRFRVDITSLVLTAPPSALFIELQREGALPVEFECPVAIDSARWGRVASYEIPVTLVVPLRCEVVGRVVGPAEQIARPHPHAAPSVAVFEWSAARPQVAATLSAPCDRSSGDFRVQLECDREYVLVALLDGCRPWTRKLERLDFLDLGRVVLERGESIAGRAQVASEPVSGAVRARFKHASAGEYIQCCIAGRWLVWTGAGFEWESQGVVSDQRGRFELSGLAPASYTLELGSMQNAYASAASVIEVIAPSLAIELGPRMCRVELQVFESGAPAAERTLEISEVGRSGTIIGTHRTDTSGVATLWVDPARTTSVALAPLAKAQAARPGASKRIECAPPGAALSMRVDF